MKEPSKKTSLISRKGSDRVNDDVPVAFMEYANSKTDELKKTEKLHNIPDEINVSEQIHGTVYDVTGVFDGKLNKSLLQQFKEIILSEQTA